VKNTSFTYDQTSHIHLMGGLSAAAENRVKKKTSPPILKAFRLICRAAKSPVFKLLAIFLC